ncbi:unnamed protein product [Euphydryas editha]|uniref:Reverse transcriptase domain-containing protein n=1 Tax=Euphydryas editha TaxID=104508 RepID=A0AAU9UET6_EUPED|nr:unnamed protein product [Euphydryas editha]
MVFIDLEKAFDRIPRRLVWQPITALEYYIDLVRDTYERVSTQVSGLAGTSKPFEVEFGVHQGSAMCPLLFNLSMDYLTKHVQAALPWCIL